MGDTESVFDVLASEMASTTLRFDVNDGGGSPRRSRQLAACDRGEERQRPPTSLSPSTSDEPGANVGEEDVVEAVTGACPS